MSALFWLIDTILTLAVWIIIIHVIMSWLINFQVINLQQPIVYQIWKGLNQLTEPIYRPIRRLLPDLGGIDLAPLIVIIGIMFVQRLILVDVARAVF
ncbi:MAG: YggT family protein [Pseudomonadota bacterium]